MYTPARNRYNTYKCRDCRFWNPTIYYRNAPIYGKCGYFPEEKRYELVPLFRSDIGKEFETHAIFGCTEFDEKEN